jgi:hypothetical protein
MATPMRIRPAEPAPDPSPEEHQDVLPAPAADPIPVEPVDDCPDALPALEAEARRRPRLERAPWVMPAPREPLTLWGLVRLLWRGFASACEWLFGAVTLIAGLAVLAAIPVVGLLSLGYLLEAGGRIARTGRVRDGFIGVRQAARVGSLVLGTWLMLLPLRLVSSYLASAQIIDPDGPSARNWWVALVALTIVVGLHVALACLRGGRLRYFFWPVGNVVWLARRLGRGGYYAEARDAVWDFVAGLRLPYYFWLGLRGFVGAAIWLVIPVTLFALGRKNGAVGFLGGVLLAWVLMYVPILQMRFARDNRFAAFFEPLAARRHFNRAPWAFTFSLFITLLFSLPLYLLKIEMVPQEAAGLLSLFFVVFIFPTRLLQGWACGRSCRRETPRHWFFRWTGRLAMVPVTAFYVFLVFFTQYTSWGGVWSLYEQHAFLLPAPFSGGGM